MPDYKTHSIHSEIVFKNIRNRSNINPEELKIFAFGPDSLISTNYKLFDYQHSHRTKDYFVYLLKTIKDKKLQDNSKVMSFLYGQLDHFILDVIIHPLIYYMTEKMPARYKLKPHTLVELWISDYIMKKHFKGGNGYYHNNPILDKELREIIDSSYEKIYQCKNVSTKYELGARNLLLFDNIRFSDNKLLKKVCNTLKLGDFFYNRTSHRVRPFLNLNHKIITNPVTGVEFKSSFNDLWEESIMVASELIEDVDRYLYLDRPLNNYYINGNISYNTGLPCQEKEHFRFVKRYKK